MAWLGFRSSGGALPRDHLLAYKKPKQPHAKGEHSKRALNSAFAMLVYLAYSVPAVDGFIVTGQEQGE